MTAGGTMSAESSIVPGTVFNFRVGVDVEKRALFIRAGVESRVEIAFRHFGHIILVQELALISLFAESPQPMLAHHCSVSFEMSEGARCIPRTAAFHVEGASLCPGLVHTGEGQRGSSQLMFEGKLDLEDHVVAVRYYFVHGELLLDLEQAELTT